MKRNLLAVILAVCLSGHQASVVAAGADVGGIYRALVPVASQQVDDRRQALNTALFDVLMKVSGQPRERLAEVFGPVIEGPVRFVREYRYESLPELASGPDGTVRGLGLGVEFDKAAVDRLLRDAALPVWGRIRPTTVVWLAVESGGTRRLEGEEDRPGLWNAVKRRAAQRGLPLVIPLLDVEDRSRLTVADVWGGFRESIREASARYGGDAILVGRFFQGTSGLEESSWLLYRQAADGSWRHREGAHAIQAVAAVDRLTESIAGDFAGAGIPGSLPGRIEMEVSGVRVLEHYGRLMAYLEGLDAVASVRPVVLDGDRLTLSVDAAETTEQVLRTVALGQVLRPVSTEGILRFELAP